MNNFVALHRGEDADVLQKNHPSAFLLLNLIARRARYTTGSCPLTGLKHGEAFIGDWKAAGLKSEKAYRCAKLRLESGQLCAFKRATQGAKRGTIATLLTKAIFSISMKKGADARAPQGRSKGEIGATNNKVTKKQGNNPPIVPRLLGVQGDDSELLEDLWRRTPKRGKERTSKHKVRSQWLKIPKSKRPIDNEIIKALEAWKLSDKWTKDGGEYVEGLCQWIKNRAWESLPEQASQRREEPTCKL